MVHKRQVRTANKIETNSMFHLLRHARCLHVYKLNQSFVLHREDCSQMEGHACTYLHIVVLVVEGDADLGGGLAIGDEAVLVGLARALGVVAGSCS
jgi:hypothetical protein